MYCSRRALGCVNLPSDRRWAGHGITQRRENITVQLCTSSSNLRSRRQQYTGPQYSFPGGPTHGEMYVHMPDVCRLWLVQNEPVKFMRKENTQVTRIYSPYSPVAVSAQTIALTGIKYALHTSGRCKSDPPLTFHPISRRKSISIKV